MLTINPTDTAVTPKWLIVLCVAFVILRIVACFCDNAFAQNVSGAVAWTADPGDKTSLEGKPVLYYFTASWSNASHLLETQAFNNKDVIQLINDNFVPVKVVDTSAEHGYNTREVQKLEDKYNVNDFPAVVITLSDGTFCSEHDGSMTRNAAVYLLTNAIKDMSHRAGSEAFARGQFEVAERLLAKCAQNPNSDFLDRRYAWLRRYVALRMLARDNDAAQCLKEALEHENDPPPWPYPLTDPRHINYPYPLINYFAGNLPIDKLKTEDHPETTANLAMIAYANHNPDKCAQYLKDILSVSLCKDYYDSRAARTLVQKLPEKLRQPLEHI